MLVLNDQPTSSKPTSSKLSIWWKIDTQTRLTRRIVTRRLTERLTP